MGYNQLDKIIQLVIGLLMAKRKKILKLLKNPPIFFRDYLNKKYPNSNIEQPFLEDEEPILIKADEKLNALTAKMLPEFPIDVVFTWVDGSDEKWLKKYHQTMQTQQPENIGLYANDSARFENHNELYYSVFAVQKFMPWVRNIFIVTDEQIPKWLNSSNFHKIKIIDHKQIIDEKYLPTFNSHVIEAHLHNIPELSEHFIYFNDDVFVARYLDSSHFFQSNGLASIFPANKSIKAMLAKGIKTPTLLATLNSIELLKQNYDCDLDRPIVHTYSPLCKTAYHLAWEKYAHEIKIFLNNKVRGSNDLNFSNFFIPWLMYLESKSCLQKEICYYFNIRSPNAISQYRKLLERKAIGKEPHSFCANDFNSLKITTDYPKILINMLSDYYQI